MDIIHENEYTYLMKNTAEPYLSLRRRNAYVPGADYPFHREDMRIVGKLHVQRYLADDPRGVIVISHGFTEAAPKYDELIYYFLQAGYHVYIPEHCGHGMSYRLTGDPSLVYVDTWRRYVRDFLKVCRYIRKSHPDLPLDLFAHSMGGAIGGIAAAWEPQWFNRIILNSPMIRPLTGKIPWPVAVAIAEEKRLTGKGESYVAGKKPYSGTGTFEKSSATSKPRYERYSRMRQKYKELQTCSPSYSWLWASAKMSWYLRFHAWKEFAAPVLVFQAEDEDLVSVRALRRFAKNINDHGMTTCEYACLPGTKHEIYSSDDNTMSLYVNKILDFLGQ